MIQERLDGRDQETCPGAKDLRRGMRKTAGKKGRNISRGLDHQTNEHRLYLVSSVESMQILEQENNNQSGLLRGEGVAQG